MTSQTTTAAAGSAREKLGDRLRSHISGWCGRAVLGAHALAVKLDRLPEEFGRETPVDESDPKAVAREWLRQLRLWVAYNPEEVFAIKVWAGVGVLGLVTLLVIGPALV